MGFLNTLMRLTAALNSITAASKGPGAYGRHLGRRAAHRTVSNLLRSPKPRRSGWRRRQR